MMLRACFRRVCLEGLSFEGCEVDIEMSVSTETASKA